MLRNFNNNLLNHSRLLFVPLSVNKNINSKKSNCHDREQQAEHRRTEPSEGRTALRNGRHQEDGGGHSQGIVPDTPLSLRRSLRLRRQGSHAQHSQGWLPLCQQPLPRRYPPRDREDAGDHLRGNHRQVCGDERGPSLHGGQRQSHSHLARPHPEKEPGHGGRLAQGGQGAVSASDGAKPHQRPGAPLPATAGPHRPSGRPRSHLQGNRTLVLLRRI